MDDKFLQHMSFDSLKHFREYHPAWRLMAADNAPFIMSFLYEEFIFKDNREIPEHVLISHLEIHIDKIPHIQAFSKTAHDYLKQWADEEYGWLRRFYPTNSDEIHYDLTSTAQMAIEWIVGLKKDTFIGTESRLILVFELLNQITKQSQTDPQIRIRELERQKAEINEEILRAKRGEIKLLEPVQIKERFMQAMYMSREILSDFRAVEQNFRELNRDMREKIACWDKGKGELVGDYFLNQRDIYNTEQGRSFKAFFEFLMSSEAQDDLEQTLNYLHNLETIREMVNSSGISEISDKWMDGCSHVWTTVEAMSEQISRYVDENYLEEDRRINQVIKQIELKVISLNGQFPKGEFMSLDRNKPDVNLIFDRTLFSPPKKIQLVDVEIEYGKQVCSDEALYAHISVDKEKLISQINSLLIDRDEVGLVEVVEKFPLKFGLTELLAYMDLGRENVKYNIDKAETDIIMWKNVDGDFVQARPPRVIYHKSED